MPKTERSIMKITPATDIDNPAGRQAQEFAIGGANTRTTTVDAAEARARLVDWAPHGVLDDNAMQLATGFGVDDERTELALKDPQLAAALVQDADLPDAALHADIVDAYKQAELVAFAREWLPSLNAQDRHQLATMSPAAREEALVVAHAESIRAAYSEVEQLEPQLAGISAEHLRAITSDPTHKMRPHVLRFAAANKTVNDYAASAQPRRERRQYQRSNRFDTPPTAADPYTQARTSSETEEPAGDASQHSSHTNSNTNSNTDNRAHTKGERQSANKQTQRSGEPVQRGDESYLAANQSQAAGFGYGDTTGMEIMLATLGRGRASGKVLEVFTAAKAVRRTWARRQQRRTQPKPNTAKPITPTPAAATA